MNENTESVPCHANGKPKKSFLVKMLRHANGEIEKAIFIDGEKLDWSIDISSYIEACKMGMQYKTAVQSDIAKHFTESVSDFIGRHITMEELKQAIKTGWI